MRFNGKDIRDVHRALSVNKEIPPGTARRTIDYAEGRRGATVAGVRYEADEYKARINICCWNADDAWDVRALLAGWAAASGEETAELEPTHWRGKCYDAILFSISAPEFTRGFATIDVIFSVPYPFARDIILSRAAGTGSVTTHIGGTHECRPVIRQTIREAREGVMITMDGTPVMTIKGALEAGQVVEMDVMRESLTIDGENAAERIDTDPGAMRWTGFTPGRHTFVSEDSGSLELEWYNEWM